LDLADEAYLRRIGYKIEFGYLTHDEYARIWADTCKQNGIACDADVLGFALNELHGARGVPLLPCHPRDLLNIAVDQASYLGDERRVTKERLAWAWQNYFVSIKGDQKLHTAPTHGGSQVNAEDQSSSSCPCSSAVPPLGARIPGYRNDSSRAPIRTARKSPPRQWRSRTPRRWKHGI